MKCNYAVDCLEEATQIVAWRPADYNTGVLTPVNGSLIESLLVCDTHAKEREEELFAQDGHLFIWHAELTEEIQRVQEHTVVVPERVIRNDIRFKDADHEVAASLPVTDNEEQAPTCPGCGGLLAKEEGKVGQHRGQCLVGVRELNIAQNPTAKYGRHKNGMPRPKPKPADFVKDGVEPSIIREWAKEQGMEVASHGRVPQDVREKYIDAHVATATHDKVVEALEK